MNDVFAVACPDQNPAKSRVLSKLRFFWLLTVSLEKVSSAESDYLIAGSAEAYRVAHALCRLQVNGVNL